MGDLSYLHLIEYKHGSPPHVCTLLEAEKVWSQSLKDSRNENVPYNALGCLQFGEILKICLQASPLLMHIPGYPDRNSETDILR